MSSFGSILNKGRKIFITKEKGGKYARCEECNARAKLYEYVDDENIVWKLCETCITIFTNDEEDQ